MLKRLIFICTGVGITSLAACGPVCRFEPSCSRYMIGALREYGLFKGLAKGIARVLRCHPWHPGGYDPP